MEMRDFYYSEKSFKMFELGFDNQHETVCEVLINGEWKVFTEQITQGKKALSAWEDLKFLGSSDQTRYSNAVKWIEDNKEKVSIL